MACSARVQPVTRTDGQQVPQRSTTAQEESCSLTGQWHQAAPSTEAPQVVLRQVQAAVMLLHSPARVMSLGLPWLSHRACSLLQKLACVAPTTLCSCCTSIQAAVKGWLQAAITRMHLQQWTSAAVKVGPAAHPCQASPAHKASGLRRQTTSKQQLSNSQQQLAGNLPQQCCRALLVRPGAPQKASQLYTQVMREGMTCGWGRQWLQ